MLARVESGFRTGLRARPWPGIRWAAVLLPAFLVACVAVPSRVPDLQRCVWVSRFEYESAEDIIRIMRECADAGFTTVMFQVRGNATVAYSSREEVWSEKYGFCAPKHGTQTFDPLSYAVVAAHSNGLRIHAWMNMLPGWRSADPPEDRRQLYHSRPQWFLRPRGKPSRLVREGSYVWLNPCLPEVRTYLVGLCREVATEFDVDGIHMDYVRFPGGSEDAKLSPGDEASLRRFRRETGRSLEDPAALQAWKIQAVTKLVEAVRRELSSLPRPPCLTAAVLSDPELAKEKVLQDWTTWTRKGLVDAVFPMNYTDDVELFGRQVRACIAAAGRVPVVMGIGVHKHKDSRQTTEQMHAALAGGAAGVCLFSYGGVSQAEWRDAISHWQPVR